MQRKVTKLPHIKKPCKDCPFRKDSLPGWLGAQRMASILHSDSFVCHKETTMQCAGHMLISGTDNAFVRVAKAVGIELELSGREQVFETKAECIQHHADDPDLFGLNGHGPSGDVSTSLQDDLSRATHDHP